MKIAYCTISDPRDIKSWSGTHFFIFKSLQKLGEVHCLGPLPNRWLFAAKVLNKILKLLFNKGIRPEHIPLVSKEYARQVQRRINDNYDLIFAPAASELLAHLNTKIPIIYLSDSTFSLMANYYSVFSNCFNFSLNWGEGIEKRAMNRASNIIVSSKWAAQSVIDDYHLSPDKVSIVHFGANLLHEPIEPKAVRDHDREFRLLWVGVDWERKGGKIAYELMIKLNELGINTTLFVCGCDPQITKPHRGLRSLGFLDKGITSQNAQLDEIYRQADVFILPTKSECAGIVFAEAAAYSLPIITYNTGGVSDYVHDNVNGYLLDPITATTADWLEKLTHLYKDKESYQNMSTHSFALFKHLLNWQHWLKQVEPIILQTSVKVRH